MARAEAAMADASLRLRRSWSDLCQQGHAALTPGRVVVIGLLSGFFSGTIADRRSSQASQRPRPDGEGLSLILALLRIGGTLLPLLLPSLAPAFRAGNAAGSGGSTKTDTVTEPSASA